MAQETAPVLLVVLTRLVSSTWHEGECWDAERGGQQGALGMQPAGSHSCWGAHGGKGGVPSRWGGSDVRESIGAGRVWDACGDRLWGVKRSRGGAGRHPERSRKPASPSRPCLRNAAFSLTPTGPIGRQMFAWMKSQMQPLQLGSLLKDRKPLDPPDGVSPFHVPTPSPLPRCQHSWLGVPGTAKTASSLQVRRKRQRLHEKRTSQ